MTDIETIDLSELMSSRDQHVLFALVKIYRDAMVAISKVVLEAYSNEVETDVNTDMEAAVRKAANDFDIILLYFPLMGCFKHLFLGMDDYLGGTYQNRIAQNLTPSASEGGPPRPNTATKPK